MPIQSESEISMADRACLLRRYSHERLLALTVTTIVIASLAGCSDGNASAIAAANSSNIKRVTNLYSAYQAAHSFQGPPDEAALKSFAKQQAPWRLQLMQIDPNKIDDLFISERDHQPFDIRYNVTSGPGTINALVFEHQGGGGKRQVCLNGSAIEEVDDAQYREMWEGRLHPTAKPAAPPSK
jgi:hypothetical protein